MDRDMGIWGSCNKRKYCKIVFKGKKNPNSQFFLIEPNSYSNIFGNQHQHQHAEQSWFHEHYSFSTPNTLLPGLSFWAMPPQV